MFFFRCYVQDKFCPAFGKTGEIKQYPVTSATAANILLQFSKCYDREQALVCLTHTLKAKKEIVWCLAKKKCECFVKNLAKEPKCHTENMPPIGLDF
jgi:hypothetical protein